MAVVHVELDIDGDVYPELYAVLIALRQPMLRDERMRQLAAMGLAWEAVRLHGAVVTQVPAPAPAPRSASRAAPKGAARKTASRSGSSDQPQLPVLVDVVATRQEELDAAGAS